MKCEKKRCEREATNTGKFIDFLREDVEVEPRVVLCEEHAKEAQGFPDGAAVKKWLESD